MYEERHLPFLFKPLADFDNKSLSDINMKDHLELEYDYDTDDQQILAAKSMLMKDNLESIQYFQGPEDPFSLISNL